MNPLDTKAHKIASFNPDGVGNTEANIFGLPFTTQEADVVIIPVPWDVTVSNHDGTSAGPSNILLQSPQIDLFDETVSDPWKAGIAMENISRETISLNKQWRAKAKELIQQLEENPISQESADFQNTLTNINHVCETLTQNIKEKTRTYIQQNKLVVLIGGDHSTPLGMMQAMGEFHDDLGLLQIDAHADLRDAYMGFSHSHASIMHNAAKIKSFSKFVQVGLRDISRQEADFIQQNNPRFKAFFARDIQRREFNGESWKSICDEIISELPQKVYITFDIDGLEPSQCPTTGTPVPGGLQYGAVLYLFEQLVASGKTIVGFDLVETGPGHIDGIVACRILYKTIALMLKSNRRL